MSESVMLWRGKLHGKPRPRFTRQGHAYTPSDYRKFEQAIASEYVRQGGKFYTGEVEVTLMVARKSPKAVRDAQADIVTPDEDNLLKAFQDALNGVAYADDKQVTRARVDKLPRRPKEEDEAVLIVRNFDRKTNEERIREWKRYTASTRS